MSKFPGRIKKASTTTTYKTDSGIFNLNSVFSAPAVPAVEAGLYAFTSATFTSGPTVLYEFGPSLAQARAGLTGTGVDAWKNDTQYFNTSSGIQIWVVPKTGTYRIETYGAQGANCNRTGAAGGLGAQMIGDFQLSEGQIIHLVVGQQGETQTNSWGGGGGGGGSFVWDPNSLSTPLIAAGGGGCGGQSSNNQQHGRTQTSGGAGSNNGGAGGTGGSASYSNGICGGGGGQGWTGGSSYACGGAFTWPALYNNPRGHVAYGSIAGGFGGGGGSYGGGGGGGGYSGGGAGGWSYSGYGGGGGSYNSGSNVTNASGQQTGSGQIIITLI